MESQTVENLRDATGKSFMLRFLPYLPDESVVKVIGYPNPNRGYGYGRWEEFFHTEAEARTRMSVLIVSGVIEDISLHREIPGGGLCTVVLDEWKDVGLKPTYILAPMVADPDDEPEPFLVAPPPQCKWCGTLLETYESPCSFPYCNERNEEPCED